jgi:hypothetical protein
MAQSDEKQRDRIEALRELARQQGAEAPPTDQALPRRRPSPSAPGSRSALAAGAFRSSRICWLR